MTDAPITFIWQGDCFTPASPFWAKKADATYVIGERYDLVEVQERSTKSHAHLFASIAEAHANLRDELLDEYPTPDRLRRKLLIKGGFCSEQSIVCSTRAEAQRWTDIMRQREPDSVVIARGTVVRIYVAESMSYRTMNKERFGAAKNFILNELASMLGTTPKALEKAEAA